MYSDVIKKITKPMMRFKAFHSAQATIAGIKTAHMIRKGQFLRPLQLRTKAATLKLPQMA
jgi:transposase-like protein